MSVSDIYNETRKKMDQCIDSVRESLSSIRTGRANPAIFNDLMVEYYGTPTRLQQIANITALDNKTIAITPYDQNVMNNLEKAIRDSDFGVAPVREGNVVRVTMPDITEERRRDYVKVAKEKAEGGRISVRQVRRKANDQIGKLVDDGEIGKDDGKGAEKKIDSITSEYIKKIDDMLSNKEKDLMTNI